MSLSIPGKYGKSCNLLKQPCCIFMNIKNYIDQSKDYMQHYVFLAPKINLQLRILKLMFKIVEIISKNEYVKCDNPSDVITTIEIWAW